MPINRLHLAAIALPWQLGVSPCWSQSDPTHLNPWVVSPQSGSKSKAHVRFDHQQAAQVLSQSVFVGDSD
ncbi:hypothetical protein NG796_05410 [Laspinema sp. A4]|uniref:hypothetical protein n=1 Tax=Laspinema sp. D2d TaxID=2953686 RepID=UPI0021BA3BDC|nr:hypothetical protein [Laspinema sp. D2d]MCT7982728.1 hypothetical protein [Laspinema sp. D2d]